MCKKRRTKEKTMMANAIRSNGVSASWQKGQRDAARIFNDFLKFFYERFAFSSSTPTRFPRTGTRGLAEGRR